VKNENMKNYIRILALGLQCYNLKGDVVETLTQSMKIWKDYKKSYAEGK